MKDYPNVTDDSVIRSTPSCQDSDETIAVSVQEALRLIEATVQSVDAKETVSPRAALGRVLAQPIRSTFDVPPHRNAAMDGYALRSDDLPASGVRDLTVAGTAWAGRPYNGELARGQCIRIMTGAKMPSGTDTVVINERTKNLGDRVRIDSHNRAGQNVRQPGEDIAGGETVLELGRRLGPAELGLIASIGITEVEVWRQPRVAYFSTGDELRSLGEPLREGEIYDSNQYTLYGMVREMGLEICDLGVVPDNPESIEQALRDAAEEADVVITSGGVSMGDADHVKTLLMRLGQMRFWQIAVKPGRPLAFGRIRDALFFGLPGNPVAVMVTFYQFVRPALKKLMGEQAQFSPHFRVPCTQALKKSPGRSEFQRGILHLNDRRELVVQTSGRQGSGILSSMSRANCFIVLSPNQGSVKPGDLVDVVPFNLLRY